MAGEDLLKEAFSNGSYFSNPYPLFSELRNSEPVFYSSSLGGWVVTKYADVSEILHNHQDYSSKGRVLHLINKLDPQIQEQLPMLKMHFATGLAHSDAPEHKRLRGILAQAFTPKISENMRPIARAAIATTLDPLAGEVDLIAALFAPVPALVVGRLLGSSESDIPDLIRWASAINGLYEKGGIVDPAKAIFAEAILHEIRGFVTRLATERRELRDANKLDPTQDVIAGLVSVENQGDSLTEDELLSTVVTLFVAGHETTTHLLGNGMLALLNQGELFELSKENFNWIPTAVDEMARFDGSVPRSWRITKREVEIGGTAIPQGELVLPMLSSANRDEDVFENPDQFNVHRDSRKHVAFGRGVHVCLGAPLARIEGQEILKKLVQRYPRMELNIEMDKLEWRRDVALRGLISLPVTL